MCHGRGDEGGCNGDNFNSGAGHHMNRDLTGVRYMMIGPYEPSEVGAINLFKGPSCTGEITRVYWNPNDPVESRYRGEDLKALGITLFEESSLMLPEGYHVKMYDSDFRV